MSDYTVDLGAIDWRGRDGLRYRAHKKNGTIMFKPRIGNAKDLIRWASGKSNYYISKILNQFWNATAFSFPSPLYFAGWTASLTAASTGATAGEASYTGYARVSKTANTTNFPTSSGAAAIQNATAITWPSNPDVGTSTWTYIAVLDVTTLGAGNILFWGSITSAAITTGVTPQIDINGLTASEA